MSTMREPATSPKSNTVHLRRPHDQVRAHQARRQAGLAHGGPDQRGR
ncbi:hypothetical protein [Listeria monocytogenes]|nr:hypothetical protein [Listeria monocytogenes]